MQDLDRQLEQWAATRRGCPPPSLLIAVEEDVLPEDLAGVVRSHLAGCPLCRCLQQDLQAECMEPSLGEIHRTGKRILAPPPATVWRRAWAYAAAAVVAVGSFVALRDRGVAPTQTAVTKPTVIPKSIAARVTIDRAPLKLGIENALVWRGEDSTAQPYLAALKAALHPYFRSQDDEACRLLKGLAAAYPKESEPRFYLAVSSLLRNDAATAIPLLEQLRTERPAHLEADIPWYLAAAYEKAGQTAQSTALIREICQSPGPYQQRACAIGTK